MITVTKSIGFCIGHRLLNYSGDCKNIHGHNLTASVTFGKESPLHLNDSGMVVDFKVIKNEIKSWIDEYLDHGFVANCFDLETIGFIKSIGGKLFVMPNRAHYLDRDQQIALANPTMENITLLIATQARRVATKNNVKLISVQLFESTSSFATLSF